MDTCVLKFSLFTGCSLGDAIRCAAYNPAQCIFLPGLNLPTENMNLMISAFPSPYLDISIVGREHFGLAQRPISWCWTDKVAS